MTNNELLLAISDMMDTKLKTELQPLKNEMLDMKTEMRNLKTEMRGLEGEMQGLEGEMQGLEGEMQEKIHGLGGEIQELRSEIHQIKLFQENVILPRLDTIESCYLDTYHRYRDNADRMEAVYMDVDIMKKVINEHSQKLQKLA